jgi:hypothetical protein
MGYMASAELGTHLALNWPQPANVLDPYIEFRHHSNDGSLEPEDRDKGFYGIGGALRYFLEDAIDSAHKKDMRSRIVQGPPFTPAERAAVLDYCEEDTRALARLVPHIIPTVRSLPHALHCGKFQWTIAQQEHRGLPVDLPTLTRLRTQWDAIRCDLVIEKDHGGIYEIVDGRAHWRKQEFANYLQRTGLAPVWPRLPSGAFDETDEAFKEMEGRYPQIKELRQLRYTLSKLKIKRLRIAHRRTDRAARAAFLRQERTGYVAHHHGATQQA